MITVVKLKTVIQLSLQVTILTTQRVSIVILGCQVTISTLKVSVNTGAVQLKLTILRILISVKK